jgi:hypothetical protein
VLRLSASGGVIHVCEMNELGYERIKANAKALCITNVTQ